MEILVVIDMQNDFISGTLGSQQARGIVPSVVEKVSNWQGEVLFTRDTHQDNYLDTQEGRILPVVHCVEGSEGWEICKELQEYVKSEPLDKPSFGGLELPDRIRTIIGNCPESEVTITLLGLCTDICVISNAMILKPAFPEACVVVDSNCCAGVTTESHINALSAMKMCQIDIL